MGCFGGVKTFLGEEPRGGGRPKGQRAGRPTEVTSLVGDGIERWRVQI